jgi:hypothetical protein
VWLILAVVRSFVFYLIKTKKKIKFYFLDGFATSDLAFFWEENQNISAIRVNEDLEMPDFVLSNHEARYCNRTTATG